MSTINSKLARALIVLFVLAGVLAGHWLTPDKTHAFHAFHVVLQKLFLLPVVLAAVWFGLRGAVSVGMLSSLLYLPFILVRVTGQTGEALEQYGELLTIWITAFLAGVFVDRERSALRSLADLHEGALVALVSALDARERNTHLHSLRVRAYAARIGRVMGLKAQDLTLLSEGALLHDIGKIGVPDAILLKPGALTEEEWTMMRQHPEIGRRILEPVPFLRDAAKIVYAHHERYDGKGYPGGLTGEEIPVGARIFAVADVFDALTTDRPYHGKRAAEEAIQMIKDESGTHFDTSVVQAFLSVPVREWSDIARTVSVEAEAGAGFQAPARAT